jgi:predicted transposase/invertase (TIGR01784 family)
MGERSVYYWAKNYADLKRGEEYDQLNRTVAINILGFNLFEDKKYPDMHSCFGIYDVQTGCQLTDKLEIHFLELLKFKSKNVKEMNRMEKWTAYFSPSTPDEELAEIAASEAAIQEAMEVEDVFTKDEVAKRSYEKAEKFRRDQAAQLRYAAEEGRKEGEAESLKKAVAMLKKLKINKDLAITQIIETYSLSHKEASALVNSNW